MFEHLDDPTEFVPEEAFRRRATEWGRRLRARRRLTAAASTVVVAGVLAAAAVVAVPGAGGDDGDDVRTGPAGRDHDPKVVVPDPPVALPADELVREPVGLIATPASGHREGDQVVVRLDPPAGREDNVVTVCAAEVLDHVDELPTVSAWCGRLATIASATEAAITVERRFEIPEGVVDCADAPGRCILVVAEGGAASGLRYAPLVMADDLGEPQAEVRVHGAGGTLADGTGIRIEADGFTPRTTVRIALCDPLACDRSPRVRTVDVGAGGRFAVDFRVFLEILHVPSPASVPGRPIAGWASCRPCRLEVGDHLDRVSLPLDLAPTDDPIRPQVTFEGGDGPLAPGSTVRVTGTGFQPGAADLLELAWCPAAIAHLDLGEAESEGVGCSSPPEGRPRTTGSDQDGPSQPSLVPNEAGYTVDDDGTFVVERFPLPAADTVVGGVRCAATPGSCTLAWVQAGQLPFAGLSAEQTVPLDLSG